MNTNELIAEAVSLPVEERTRVVENLLSSLNPPEPDVDAAWSEIARRRLKELRSGKVEAVAGEAVFERIAVASTARLCLIRQRLSCSGSSQSTLVARSSASGQFQPVEGPG